MIKLKLRKNNYSNHVICERVHNAYSIVKTTPDLVFFFISHTHTHTHTNLSKIYLLKKKLNLFKCMIVEFGLT
jgi:hypothetical protein